jgi:hypothetical protein
VVSRELVFVHGRSQQHRNAEDLKKAWIDAWKQGLAKSSLQLPTGEDAIRFPYYGDTLDGLVRGVPESDLARVVVRGEDEDRQQQAFVAAVLDEIRRSQGISDEQVAVEAPGEVVERGPQNWPWVQGILKAIDRHVPGASATSLAVFTHDVYKYLGNPGIQDVIDNGVCEAFTAGVETVVVGHSLGSVVSYRLLNREGQKLGWVIPLYVTVGCPLAISAIKKALRPISDPKCVSGWFNARDDRDVVALYPLDAAHFDVDPAIKNKNDVRNRTNNRHGISGYLDDPVVARQIYDALIAP